MEIATDTPAGCFGVGGALSESVWIKAAATAVEPFPVRDSSYQRMNIANSRSCEQPRAWEPKSFEGRPTPDADLDTSERPGLAAVRRLGIRVPDGNLLHTGIGHLHPD